MTPEMKAILAATPGRILLEEFLKPMGISQAEFARRRVDRLQHASLRRPGEQGQRRGRVAAFAQHAVHRQLRQQDAGPEGVMPR